MADISIATHEVINSIVFAAHRQERQFAHVVQDMELNGEHIAEITVSILGSFTREKDNAEFITELLDATWDEDTLLTKLKERLTVDGDSHVLNVTVSEIYAGSGE